MDFERAAEPGSVLSVEKALSIAELLLQSSSPLSARDVADRVAINRTTTHRLLNTLIRRGWAERSPDGGYQLSVKVLAMAHVATQLRDFLSEIRPSLLHLSELSRETVHVGILDGYDVIHIDKIESLERVGVSSRIGARGVTHQTSLGRALLAAQTDDFVTDYIAQGVSREPPFKVQSPESVVRTVERTRELGFSTDDEEDSIGVRCLGVAVRGTGGVPLFAISLTGPSPRFTREVCTQLAPDLCRVAAKLSTRFGWNRPVAQDSLERKIGDAANA